MGYLTVNENGPATSKRCLVASHPLVRNRRALPVWSPAEIGTMAPLSRPRATRASPPEKLNGWFYQSGRHPPETGRTSPLVSEEKEDTCGYNGAPEEGEAGLAHALFSP